MIYARASMVYADSARVEGGIKCRGDTRLGEQPRANGREARIAAPVYRSSSGRTDRRLEPGVPAAFFHATAAA